MAFVITVIADATTLRGKCADHVKVGFSSSDEFIPQESTPAALNWEMLALEICGYDLDQNMYLVLNESAIIRNGKNQIPSE